MINVRKDLIDKELNEIRYLAYKKIKLSNRFIDWLFRHYYTAEFTEHYYDNEDEAKDRLTFRTWIDPYGKGIWNMSQQKVDKKARDAFYEVRSTTVKKNDRLYIAYEGDYIFIYWYGRDFMEIDYWWVMRKKG